jgi:nitroreductase
VKEFNIPENLVPAAILMLGYPGDDAVPADRHGERVPLEKTVFWEKVD